MEQYLKKIDRLKAGERNPSVVRSRSVSVDPVNRNESRVEGKIEREDAFKISSNRGKVVYQKDIEILNVSIENMRMALSDIKNSLEQNNQDFKKQIEEIAKTIDNVKQETEQTKSERLKQKLDSFISSYNQNESAHSDVLKNIELEIKELNKRLNDVEEVL